MRGIFWTTALFHAASVASRFDVLAAKLSPTTHAMVLFATFPLLFVEAWFEGKMDYGPDMKDFPLWMRIRSWPVKLTFTFAFIYLSTVVLQAWDVSIGPIDPTPPAQWGLGQRAFWFTMFTVGMFFPFYLAATSGLIPVMRALTTPFRWLPAVVGVPLAAAVGAAAGWGAVLALGKVATALAPIHELIREDKALTIGVALAVALIPVLFTLLGVARETRRS